MEISSIRFFTPYRYGTSAHKHTNTPTTRHTSLTNSNILSYAHHGYDSGISAASCRNTKNIRAWSESIKFYFLFVSMKILVCNPPPQHNDEICWISHWHWLSEWFLNVLTHVCVFYEKIPMFVVVHSILKGAVHDDWRKKFDWVRFYLGAHMNAYDIWSNSVQPNQIAVCDVDVSWVV